MADPQAFALPVVIERGEALATLQELLAEVPGASTTYAERHNNAHLPGSPATLLEADRLDHGVREVHGDPGRRACPHRRRPARVHRGAGGLRPEVQERHEEVTEAKPRQPFAFYWTREELQAALEFYLGERLAKLRRAIRRAEKRAAAAEAELAALRRELHSEGTSL